MVLPEIATTILIILDISAVILNGVVAFLLKKHKKTRIVTFFFIYCLSISDVMVGVVSLASHSLFLDSVLNPKSKVFTSTLKSASYILFRYFISLSGSIILLIAIDRCIHMKYLIRYNEIMTQFRARVLLLANILFGMLLIIPPLLSTEDVSSWYYFVLNIVCTTGTFMIYVIYIKTYLTIKRQVATVKIDDGSHIVVQSISGNTKQCEGRSPNFCKSSGCINLDRSKRLENNQDIVLSKSVKTEKDNTSLALQKAIFVLPVAIALSPSNIDDGCNDIELKTICSDCVENVKAYPDNEIPIKHEKRVKRKLSNRDKKLKNKVAEKIKRRKIQPEMEFRKATWMILLSLFVCYIPSLINNFYMSATRDYTFSLIAQIPLILNSSLNAVILIICNREIKRNIKAIFGY